MADEFQTDQIQLQWPEQELGDVLQFQKSLWELASAIGAEHALSLPIEKKQGRTSPSPPVYEPDWLIVEPEASAAESAPAMAPQAESIPQPICPKFAEACYDLDGLIAQLDTAVLNTKD